METPILSGKKALQVVLIEELVFIVAFLSNFSVDNIEMV